jgi:uncharacterized protein (DUF1501 family)
MFENPTTRRIFIQRGLTMLAVGATVPTFLDQTVMAIADPHDTPRTQKPSGKDGKILVIVQLAGGNDGLNTVIPFADDHYHRARPTLAHSANDVMKLNDYLGLHPNLAPLKAIYDDGRMGIVQGVGYPNPNRSHFRSTDIWASGIPDKEIVTSGWIGRYFDNTCQGEDPHVGVAMGEQLPLTMKGERVLPLSFDRPETYRYNGRDKDGYMAVNRIGGTGASPVQVPADQHGRGASATKPEIVTASSQLNFLERTAMDAQLSSDDILRMTSRHQPAAEYPNGQFGNGLRTIAAMIAGGLPTRVYYVSLGGFDTHANEKGRHDQLMTQFAQGVSAFWKDLKKQSNDDRVLMMTFSEFGRRVATNASGGTDHGTAAPMFLFGPRIRPGVIGNHPSLTDLDQGDLKFHTDFRNVYATILQDWMNTPSKPVLGAQFNTLPVLRA